MCLWSNGEEACYVDGGGYLEEGFQGGTLQPTFSTWRWPPCGTGRVRGGFLGEVVGSIGLVLFPSVSFALRLPQAIM